MMGNAEVIWSGPERVPRLPSMLCLVEVPFLFHLLPGSWPRTEAPLFQELSQSLSASGLRCSSLLPEQAAASLYPSQLLSLCPKPRPLCCLVISSVSQALHTRESPGAYFLMKELCGGLSFLGGGTQVGPQPNRVKCVGYNVLAIRLQRHGSVSAEPQAHGCVRFSSLLGSRSAHAGLQLVRSASCQIHFPRLSPVPLISTLLTPEA